MNGDKWTRGVGYLAVFAVSTVAALLSYWHAVTVVGHHGEPGVYGHLYPATIDGLIIAASMVLLDSARRHVKAPKLAWVLIGLGIAATLGANILDGITGGMLGSIIAAWPALAFIGAYEMIMVLIRSHAAQAEEIPVAATVAVELPQVREATGSAVELEPPSLKALLTEKSSWTGTAEPENRVRVPQVTEAFNPPDSRPYRAAREETQAAAIIPEMTDPSPTGTIHVTNPLGRLDRKALGQTGSFGAVTE